MTKISIYSVDNNVTGNDKWIGSDSQNFNATKNFTPNKLADYFNHNQVVDTGNELRYTYQTLDPLEARARGTLSFITEIGPQVNFSAITTFLLSKYTLKQNDVSDYLDFLNGSQVIISKASDTNLFALYKITNVSVYLPEPNFFNIDVTFVDGNGFIYEDQDYIISLALDKYNQPITNTSQLINDGSDGIHPFITAQDLPAQITLTTTGTSGVATLIGNVLNIPDYSVGSTPTLQSVTDQGNTTTNSIIFDNGSGDSIGISNSEIQLSSLNVSGSFSTLFGISLIDNITTEQFRLNLDGLLLKTVSGGNGGIIKADLLTSTLKTYQLPNASGTIALTSDITSPTLNQVLTTGNTSILDANIGTLGIWDNANTGYMPISAVDNSFVFKDSIANKILSAEQSILSLFKSNTIAANLSSTSLTISRNFAFPDTSGTIALTSDIPSLTGYVPYTGATSDLNLGTHGLLTDKLSLNTTPTQTLTAAGQMIWNDTDGTLDIRLKGNNVTLQVGQESIVRVVNKAGADLLEANFQAVRVRSVAEGGAAGQRLAVVLAQADNDADSATTLGIVTETINNNQEGFITTSGEVKEINTTGAKSFGGLETWVDGDMLFLDPLHAGYLTNVKPSAPNHLIVMGYVVYAHAVHGKIFVKVDNGYELNELHNVYINPATLADGDLIQYDSTTSVWENKSLSAAGIQPTLPTLTSGSVLFSNGTTIAQDNANFFWDDTNNRLGIGITTPNESLHVKGNIQIGQGTGVLEKIWCSGGNLISYDPIPGNISIGNGRIVTNAVTQTTTIANSLTVDGNIQLGAGVGGAETLTSASGGSMISFNGTNEFNIANGTISSNIISQVVSTNFFLGVGTTAPSARLHVDGSMYLQNSATGVESITFSNGPQIEANGPLGYFKSGQVYTNTFVNFVGIGTSSPTTELEVAGVITATGGNSTSWNAKQDALVSGTNIKTINGSSVLGSGDLTIGGSGGGIHAQKTIYTGQYTNLYVVYAGAPSTQAATANRLICMPFFPNQTFTSQSLVVNVTTLSAGGLAKVLIFDDVDGRPITKLYESADFDCSTTGQKTASVSFTFTAGTTYWIGFVCNNGTNAFSHLGQGSVYAFSTNSATGAATHGWLSVTYASIPSTLSALSYQSGNIPLVSIRNS